MIGAMVVVLLLDCLERGASVRPMVRRAVIIGVSMGFLKGMDIVEDFEKNWMRESKEVIRGESVSFLSFFLLKMSTCA